ncbi:MAG: hypothetical protein HY599_06815 [Candidatus Omnitrophica bacterium]|nr:hypothetical protein [Candidatus Omnitrophota bacterium]
MKRILAGVVLGLMVAAAAHSEEPKEELKLQERELENVRGNPFKIPETYGRLVNVVVNGEVHYLYFEDGDGQIRVVLIGQRGAVQRSRNPLQLLTGDVQLIKRGGDES